MSEIVHHLILDENYTIFLVCCRDIPFVHYFLYKKSHIILTVQLSLEININCRSLGLENTQLGIAKLKLWIFSQSNLHTRTDNHHIGLQSAILGNQEIASISGHNALLSVYFLIHSVHYVVKLYILLTGIVPIKSQSLALADQFVAVQVGDIYAAAGVYYKIVLVYGRFHGQLEGGVWAQVDVGEL